MSRPPRLLNRTDAQPAHPCCPHYVCPGGSPGARQDQGAVLQAFQGAQGGAQGQEVGLRRLVARCWAWQGGSAARCFAGLRQACGRLGAAAPHMFCACSSAWLYDLHRLVCVTRLELGSGSSYRSVRATDNDQAAPPRWRHAQVGTARRLFGTSHACSQLPDSNMAGRKRGAAPAAFSVLLSLPTELQSAVFTHLEDRDKAQLASTCRCGCRA